MKAHFKIYFVSGLVCFFILALCGCDNSSNSEKEVVNLGTPDCPLCGEWETPEGISTNSQLSIQPDSFRMTSKWKHRMDCDLISETWKTTGDREGFISLENVLVRCDKIKTSNTTKKEKYKFKYHLGNYTLMIVGQEKNKVLYTRRGAKIPEQQNPLIGKWGALKSGEKPSTYIGKWHTIPFRIWFKKDSFQTDEKSNYLKKYIVENDKVYIVARSGKWSIVHIIGPNTIRLKPGSLPFRPRSILMMPGLWQKKELRDKEIVFSKVE